MPPKSILKRHNAMRMKRELSPPVSDWSYREGSPGRPDGDGCPPPKRSCLGREEPLDLTTRKYELGPSSLSDDSSLKSDPSRSPGYLTTEYEKLGCHISPTPSPKAPTALKKRLLRDFMGDQGEYNLSSPEPSSPIHSLPSPKKVENIIPDIRINSSTSPKLHCSSNSYQKRSLAADLKMCPTASPSDPVSRNSSGTHPVRMKSGGQLSPSPRHRGQEEGSPGVFNVNRNVLMSGSTVSSYKDVPSRPACGRPGQEGYPSPGLTHYPPPHMGLQYLYECKWMGYPQSQQYPVFGGNNFTKHYGGSETLPPPGFVGYDVANAQSTAFTNSYQHANLLSPATNLQLSPAANLQLSPAANLQLSPAANLQLSPAANLQLSPVPCNDLFERPPSKDNFKDRFLAHLLRRSMPSDDRPAHIGMAREFRSPDPYASVRSPKPSYSPLSRPASLPASLSPQLHCAPSYRAVPSSTSLRIPIPVPVTELHAIGGEVTESVQVSCLGLSGGSVKTFPVLNQLKSTAVVKPYKLVVD